MKPLTCKKGLRKQTGTDSPPSREREGTVRRAQDEGDETGAVLILALIFLVVIGLLVGGLASWTANGLSNTLTFSKARSAQFALSSATQVAVQSIRYTPLLAAGQTVNASPPNYCWGTAASADTTYGGSELTTQNDPVNVYCSTVWNPTSAKTRVVTISACLQSALQSVTPIPNSPSQFAAACAASPGLQTIVTFDDYSPANPVVSQGQCVSTCGNGMTINSSISRTTAPIVTGLSSSNGPVVPVPAGGQNILTVTGTGFVSGMTTVNFISTSASLNLNLPGTGVTVASPGSLTVTIPAATTAVSYYVIVTTPNGSSPPGPASTYTYNPVLPTVTSIATSSGGTSGSSAGGTSLVVTGTGFMSNLSGNSTLVKFVDTANNANVLEACGQNLLAAFPSCTAFLTVNSSTQITVTTPADPYTDLNFNVQVLTAPGGSSGSGPVFTYQPFTPVVASVTPNSGTGPKSVTLTGIGFVTGATTVTLVPTTGTGTLTATNVSVTNATVLTATVPAGGRNNQVYNVEVTTSGGNSGTGGPANQYTY